MLSAYANTEKKLARIYDTVDTMSTSVPVLLDLGNILFFLGNLPQLYRSYQHRHTLRDLSIYTWVIQIFAALCFCSAGIVTGAWFAVILNGFNIAYGGVTAYWINQARSG
jgi:uncharacterized protein with PQ loop repeat